jgi:nucleotide-binding universal stress UspA family protein
VAGLGEHPWDHTVLRTAVDEAAHRGCDLHLLHAYVPRFDETLSRGLHRAQDVVAAAIEGLDPGPATSVSVLLTQDSPATALVRQSERAALVVIGSRPGALAGLILDSVSRAVLDSARCPVLVVQRGEPVEREIRVPDEGPAAEVRT